MFWKKKVMLMWILLPLLLLAPLTIVYSQLQSVRTILNDVWDSANHRLMVVPGARAQGSFQTETTIFNDVWNASTHILRTNADTVATLTPGGDFTLVQNGVVVLRSLEASATINTLYLKEGKVGIGIVPSGPSFEVWAATNSYMFMTSGTGAQFIAQAVGNTDVITGASSNHKLSIVRNNVEQMAIETDNKVSVQSLKATGAATGKAVVCVDVTTGKLYASSSGDTCAN